MTTEQILDGATAALEDRVEQIAEQTGLTITWDTVADGDDCLRAIVVVHNAIFPSGNLLTLTGSLPSDLEWLTYERVLEALRLPEVTPHFVMDGSRVVTSVETSREIIGRLVDRRGLVEHKREQRLIREAAARVWLALADLHADIGAEAENGDVHINGSAEALTTLAEAIEQHNSVPSKYRHLTLHGPAVPREFGLDADYEPFTVRWVTDEGIAVVERDGVVHNMHAVDMVAPGTPPLAYVKTSDLKPGMIVQRIPVILPDETANDSRVVASVTKPYALNHVVTFTDGTDHTGYGSDRWWVRP